MYQEKFQQFTSSTLTSNPEQDPRYDNYWTSTCLITESVVVDFYNNIWIYTLWKKKSA